MNLHPLKSQLSGQRFNDISQMPVPDLLANINTAKQELQRKHRYLLVSLSHGDTQDADALLDLLILWQREVNRKSNPDPL